MSIGLYTVDKLDSQINRVKMMSLNHINRGMLLANDQ